LCLGFPGTAAAQAAYPSCVDGDCQAIASLVADAANNFREYRGGALDALGFGCRLKPPGIDTCQIADYKTGTVTLISQQSNVSQQEGMALYQRLKAALQRAVPGWCFVESGYGNTRYFSVQPKCTTYAADGIKLSYNGPNSFVELTIQNNFT